MGLTKLQSRTFLRNMIKMGIVAKYMNDMGRQRITKYVSKKFEKGSKMSKQFKKEIHKIKELTKSIISENEGNLKSEVELQVENEKSSVNYEDDQANKKFDHQVDQINVDAPIINKNEEENKDIDRIKKDIELKNYIINRILHKYQLSTFKSKYKRTSSQLLLIKTKNSNVNAKKQKVKSNVSSTCMQQIANDTKATSFYNSIKTNLIAQKPVRIGKGVGEVFGFMEVVQNSEKNTSNITYRYANTNSINL